MCIRDRDKVRNKKMMQRTGEKTVVEECKEKEDELVGTPDVQDCLPKAAIERKERVTMKRKCRMVTLINTGGGYTDTKRLVETWEATI